MEVKQNGSDLIIQHNGASIVVHNHQDGLSVINISPKHTAAYRHIENKDSYLFSNAKPLHDWDNYKLII